MSGLQQVLNAMNEAARSERSNYHLTLGKLIDVLENLSPTLPVKCGGQHKGAPPSIGGTMSYRGYYSDLAFAPSQQPLTAGALLDRCMLALNDTFEGYKGGEYIMHKDTPLWISEYGSASGLAITGARVTDKALVLQVTQLDS